MAINPAQTDRNTEKPLTIKQAALQAGVGVETIRFYEREGLIDKPNRTASGYRQFTVDTVRRIRFIKRAQTLGFSLSEIQDLLALRIDPNAYSGDIRLKTQQKIRDIDVKIQELTRIKTGLAKLVDHCSGEGPVSDCPILDILDNDPVNQP